MRMRLRRITLLYVLSLPAFVNFSVGEPSRVVATQNGGEIRFKVTFRLQDVIWLGDPASPTTTLKIRPGAKPIATDAWLEKFSVIDQNPTRRYRRDARIFTRGTDRIVHAFTEKREHAIGSIDAQNSFVPNEAYSSERALLSSWPTDAKALKYDPTENALYEEVETPGVIEQKSLDHFPWSLQDAKGQPIQGEFTIDLVQSSTEAPSSIFVLLNQEAQSTHLATSKIPNSFRREDISIGSFDNDTMTYHPESAYRSPSSLQDLSVTVAFPGTPSDLVSFKDGRVILSDERLHTTKAAIGESPRKIIIDGQFDDWRNVPGIDDPRGDVVPYLDYVPDVDLLEFKVAHDDKHIYLYARVAGQVGRTHPRGGRSYFYAYMDVDQNAQTGFLPTRDDECYFGVDIGDDCEVQFEFVENRFLKSFYGFCGLGGDGDVLKQAVTLGPSQYGRFDESGKERAHYKSEYIYRRGITQITEDLKPGSSDSIHLAISPDGSEFEVVSSLEGFLRNPKGEPTISPGQTIDIAAGMESDSKLYPGKTRWGADSTPVIRGYRLTPHSK